MPKQSILVFARHFTVLTGMAVVLAATDHWRPSYGAISSFGLFGALHSSAIVMSLRESYPLLRSGLFVALAAGLSALTGALVLYGSRLVGMLPGMTGPWLLLALSSGIGAASYASLIRHFWMPDLTMGELISISLGCVVAAAAVLLAARLLQAFGGMWFAICWWYAFSAGLWYRQGR